MKDEEIKIAIAEFCGAVEVTPHERGARMWWYADKNEPQIGVNPYTTDLNAMNEAQKHLNPNQRELYMDYLGEDWSLVSSEAKVKAVAFVRAIGREV